MFSRFRFSTIRAQVFLLSVFVLTLLPISSFSQQLTTNKEKFLGCGTSSSIYRYLDSYWNQVSPGNDGKWGSVEPVRGTYFWTNLDKIYGYAVSRGLLYKHHTLVWGSQQPSWMTGLDTAAQRDAVTKWINAVGARYPKMTMVDVVNEPLHAPPDYKSALGGDGATGWNWVITAFTLARAACAPGVKLILNDYNILSSTTATTSYLAIVQLLKDRGLIDGIGVQGHYFEFRSHIAATTGVYVYDIPTMKANLDRLTATGLPVYITEFDIDEPIDANQLAQYKIYFPLLWNNPGVKGVTFWGYVEGDVWSSYPNTFLLHSDGTERPALTWLRTFLVSPPTPVPVSPVSTTNIARNARLVWQHADSALTYHLQVSSLRAFQTIMIDTVVADTTFRLSALDASTTYYWRVAASNTYGTSEYSTISAFTTGTVTAVGQEPAAVASEFSVAQNYPNPFNPSTLITYSLPATAHVRITIFDPLGRERARLADEVQPAGTHTASINAAAWPSGMYFYRVEAGERSAVKAMLLLK